MSLNTGLMQILASNSVATLYYDDSNTQNFFIVGKFTDVGTNSSYNGQYLVSPLLAYRFYPQSSVVVYNPFLTNLLTVFSGGNPTQGQISNLPLIPIPQ
jgi:hypothetical protein